MVTDATNSPWPSGQNFLNLSLHRLFQLLTDSQLTPLLHIYCPDSRSFSHPVLLSGLMFITPWNSEGARRGAAEHC